jgi:hypothetical protein
MQRKTWTLALAAAASAAAMAFSAAPASAAMYCSVPPRTLGPVGTLAGGCVITYKCTNPTPGYGSICAMTGLLDVYTYYAGSTGNATGRLIIATDAGSAQLNLSCTTPSNSACHGQASFGLAVGKTARGVCVGNGGVKTIFLAYCAFTRPFG